MSPHREILPIKGPLRIDLPGSKSISHRLCILAALNAGTVQLAGLLDSEDIDITCATLGNMGARILRGGSTAEIRGPLGKTGIGETYLGNSGSSARFLFPIGSILDKPFRFAGSERLHQRPFGELFAAFRELGGKMTDTAGSLPATTLPGPLRGGPIALRGLPSSQIISGLMMLAPQMSRDLEIVLGNDIPSLPYINITLRLMQRLGIAAEQEKNTIRVAAGHTAFSGVFTAERDMSAASYWVARAVISGEEVLLEGVHRPTLQGDEVIFDIAGAAGAEILQQKNGVLIRGGLTRAIEADAIDCPDLVPTLAVMALFAPGKSVIRNVTHLVHKESDRVAAVQQNIAVLGGGSAFDGRDLSITPARDYRGGLIRTFNDHRIAMSFAIAGLLIPGTFIENPGCVAKSYPGFWEAWG